MAELVYPPVLVLARGVFRAMGLRFTLSGAEHVPRTGGAVMAVNHVGYLDFTFVGLAAQPAGRLVRFMAKEEVFRHPLSGPLMRGMKHIEVDREAGMASFRAALRAVKAGEIVGLFPEATVSRSLEIKSFKSGAVRLARAGGVPLLPTVVWGSQRIWTKERPRRLGRHRFPITIAVDEPMEVPPKADPEAYSVELRRRMTRLLHEVQDAYPDRPAPGEDAWWLPARLGGSAPTLEEADALDLLAAERRRARKAARLQSPPRGTPPAGN